MQIPNGQDATTVARRNLIRIANDGNYLGGTNVGYCHWFAVVRQALGNPDFIRGLVNFKKKYYNSATKQINYDINLIRIMNNTDYHHAMNAYSNVEQRMKMFLSITDDQGNIKSENKYDEYGYEIFPSTTNIVKNHLIPSIGNIGTSDPTIEQCQIDEVHKFFSSDGHTTDTNNTNLQSLELNYNKSRPQIIDSINKGLPIHVCAHPSHHYNVFKYGNQFVVTGCGKPVYYTSLSKAIFHCGNGTYKYSVFTIPEREAILAYDGSNSVDIPKEVFAYKTWSYKPWQHCHIKVGERLLPPEKTMLLDNYIQQIKQANWNKQVAWNNFLNYQKFNNWPMMNFCTNNWYYNNNMGNMAFYNACKVVNNNPILMAYYKKKMFGK